VHIVDSLLHHILSVDQILEEITRGRSSTLELHLESIEAFHTSKRFDVIYHLASLVGPAGVLPYAGRITEHIVRATSKVIRMASEHRARLVNISTSEIYGGGENGYCQETTAKVIRGPASARQEYAVAKLACEVAIENLCRLDALDAVTVRPFNVAGARQLGGGGFVLPRFIGQAMLEQPLTIFGDGHQVRAFTDVRDVVQGIRIVGKKGRPGEAYNIGNPANKVSIQQLAEKVVRVTGSRSKTIHIDPKSLYGEHYQEAPDKFPDASRAIALGWKPKYTLDDTIRAVYAFMQQLPGQLMVQVAGLQPAETNARPPRRSKMADEPTVKTREPELPNFCVSSTRGWEWR
jgi:UDP-glucose 4-epimerase